MKNEISTPATCSTGSCGGPGLCPGIALFIAYAVGGGLATLSGLHWLGWAVGIPLALILITGVWRLLPKIGKPSQGGANSTTKPASPRDLRRS